MKESHQGPALIAVLAVTFLFTATQRCLLMAEEASPKMLPRSVERATSLISNGESNCVVIYPRDSVNASGEGYRGLAKRIGERLELLGKAPELTIAPQSFDKAFSLCGDTLKWKNVILIGNINNNHSILPLYGAFNDFTDARHPGGDGFVIRTVVRPFGARRNVVVLGGSSYAGTMRAVDEFLKALPSSRGSLPNVRVPFLFRVELGGDVEKALRPVIRSAKSQGPVPPSGGVYVATDLGYRYALTGEDIFARQARHVFLKTMGSKTGPWPVGDYTLEPFLRAWTMLADSPVFSPEERAWVEQRFLATLIANQNAYWRRRGGGYIGGRHQTMGTSAFLATARFLLQRGNANAQARDMLGRWVRECRAYFESYVAAFHDDMEGIPSYHSVQPVINYVMEEGKFSYYKEGVARLAVLRALAAVDNMGYYCGTGTYEEARPGTVKAGIMLGYPLAAAAYFYRDPRYKWLLKKFRGAGIGSWGRFVPYECHAYATGDDVKTQAPTHLLGVWTVPLGRYRYERLSKDRESSRKKRRWYTQATEEQTFEKLVFRDSFQPTGQYLVLQGFQAVGADNVAPIDANSIIRYTDLGHVFLYHNSKNQGNFWRNAVFVSDGLNTEQLPGAAELIEKSDGDDVGLAATRMRDYYGVTWTRNMVWRRGRFFVVIDVLGPGSDEALTAFCNWRTPCAAQLRDNVWEALEGEATFRLLSADGVVRISRKYPIEGAARPTILRQMQSINVGDRPVVFRNLFYAAGPERPQRYEVKPIGEHAIIARGSFCGEDVIAIVGVNGGASANDFGGIVTNAKMFYIGSDVVRLTPGAYLDFRGKKIDLAEGAGRLPPDAIADLREIWQNAELAGPASVGRGTEGPRFIRKSWRYEGFAKEFAAVSGIAISSDAPTASGEVADLVDGDIPLWRGVSWQAGIEPTLELDLHEETPIAQIELATGMISRQNALPDPDSLPKPLKARLALSSDGFENDIREREAAFQSGFTIEPLHKGTLFAMGRYRLRGINQRARYIRLKLSARAARSGLREIFVRRSDATETMPAFAVADDLDSDGRKTILIATDNCELVALSANGKELWRRRFLGAITAIRCVRLESNGAKVVLVAAMDQRIYCFEPDGTLRWASDSLSSLGGDLPCPYSIGVWQTDAGGRRQIVVGNYDHCSFLSASGRLQGHTFAHGAFETMILPEGIDLNDDGVDDTLIFNNWARISFIDGKSRKMTKGYPCHRGHGIDLRLWGNGERAKAIVVASNGLGVFDAKTGVYDWRMGVAPISSVAYVDLDGDGADEIVIGKLDGFLLCFSETGELLRKRQIGEPVLSLAALSTPVRAVVAATESKLVALDESFHPLMECGADYFSLLPLGDRSGGIVGLRRDGSVEVFRLSLRER